MRRFRNHEGLRSNCLRGTFEFRDYPLHDDVGIGEGEPVTKPVAHVCPKESMRSPSVLTIAYGIYRKSWMRLNSTSVVGHRLSKRQGKGHRIVPRRLIVATSLTSQSHPIYFQGQEAFDFLFINTAETPINLDGPLSDRITLLGVSKSAYDGVHTFANAGRQFDTVKCKNGYGPC